MINTSSLRAPLWLQAKIAASSATLKTAHEAGERAAQLHPYDLELIAAIEQVTETLRRTHLELLHDLDDHLQLPVQRDERRQA